MPTEVRVLMYSDQEVVAAVASFYRKAGRPLSVGTIRRFEIREADGVSVEFSVEAADGEVVDHAISDGDLLEALVADTIRRHIPLPNGAERRLYVIERHVTLVARKRPSRAAQGRTRLRDEAGVA
jgi:hypothetical protein